MPIQRAIIDLLARAVNRDVNPLPMAEAERLRDRYAVDGVRAPVTALPLDTPPQGVGPGEIAQGIARAQQRYLGTRNRDRAREAAQDRFIEDAERLAARLARTGNIQQWQRAFGQLVLAHLVEQAALGGGRAPTTATLRALRPIIATQLAYLQRFADDAALALLRGEPLSAAQLAARAAQYAGAARGVWYQTQAALYPEGTVVYYDSQDTGGRCSPCLAADQASPWLPSQCPVPGAICKGRHRCRCRQRAVYAPEIAKRLTARIT